MIFSKEYSFKDSRKYIFNYLKSQRVDKQALYTDRMKESKYIWAFDNETPIGFLSYDIFELEQGKVFIYTVKIHVDEKYKGSNPTLTNDEIRVSEMLMLELESKGVDILTLVPENDKLERYWIGKEYKLFPSEELSQPYVKAIKLNILDQDYLMFKTLK